MANSISRAATKAALCFLLTGMTSAAPLANASEAENRGFIWQGFQHEWRRFVVLPKEGRIPHRISRLASYIEESDNNDNQLTGNLFFAQSTGVDGNYMRPQGFYSAFESHAITVTKGQHTFNWTDNVEGEEIPISENSFSHDVTIGIEDLSASVTNLEDTESIALLNGISLTVNCDNDKQPDGLECNSNGLWPYDFYIGFDTCVVSNAISCPLNLQLHRGWTPNRGGLQIPPFFDEVKPLNKKLDIQLKVHYSIISGNHNEFNATEIDTISNTQLLQDANAINGTATAHIQNEDSQLATGISGFGFELNEPLFVQPYWEMLNSDTRQRGRYIAKLAFNVSNPIKDHYQQTAHFDYTTHVWAPITVVDSFVTTHLETTVLEFEPTTKIARPSTASGRLCINSTEQAPAFSKWEQCHLNSWWNRWIYGAPKSEDSVTINARW